MLKMEKSYPLLKHSLPLPPFTAHFLLSQQTDPSLNIQILLVIRLSYLDEKLFRLDHNDANIWKNVSRSLENIYFHSINQWIQNVLDVSTKQTSYSKAVIFPSKMSGGSSKYKHSYNT